MAREYKKLDVYKKAEELVLLIYKLTKKFPREELFGLVSQMRRAAISIVSNFVEGYGRKTIKDKVHFYNISLASLNELDFQIEISSKLSYINRAEFTEAEKLINDVIKLLNGYMRGIRNKVEKEHSSRSTDYGLLSTQSGQSLIETILAIFILTTGLASGLALAIFSFGASSDIAERITAAGLAREGTETVRMMRDTNWQQGSLADCGGALAGQQCVSSWLNGVYNITGSGGGTNYRLWFNPASTNNKWLLQADANYRLYSQSDRSLSHIVTASPTNFFRKISMIYEDTSSPYTSTHPLVLVRSSVWWHGRNCAAITDLTNPNQTNCKVISEEYLTNWRNY